MAIILTSDIGIIYSGFFGSGGSSHTETVCVKNGVDLIVFSRVSSRKVLKGLSG